MFTSYCPLRLKGKERDSAGYLCNLLQDNNLKFPLLRNVVRSHGDAVVKVIVVVVVSELLPPAAAAVVVW